MTACNWLETSSPPSQLRWETASLPFQIIRLTSVPRKAHWQDGDNIIIDGYTVNTGSYALSGGGRVKVMAVNHPSVGYSWEYWHKVIETFLKR